MVGHPLLGLGQSAVAAPEPEDADALLQQFQVAISPYGPDRAKMRWPEVARLAASLAKWRCDLKVYAYLALAVFHDASDDESAYLPLAAVLHALGDVIALGWARCLPKTDARRQGQLKWLAEELSLLIKVSPPKSPHDSALAACISAAEHTAALAGDALGVGYPLLRELRAALKEHALALPSLPPAVSVAPAVAPNPVTPPMVLPPPLPPMPVSAPLDPAAMNREAIEDQLSSLVIHHAAQLHAQSPSDPATPDTHHELANWRSQSHG